MTSFFMKNCISYSYKQCARVGLLLPFLLLCVFSMTAQCPGSIENSSSDPSITFTSTSLQAGGDSAVVVDDNGVCGLRVENVDTGQPWARARIQVNLSNNGLVAGDELSVSLDANVLSGKGRVEYNVNNAANSALIASDFNPGVDSHSGTFILPAGANTLDLWLFSNYQQSGNGGVVIYSNISITKSGGGGTDCATVNLQTEYRINSGSWPRNESSVTVDSGDNLTLSGYPNSLVITITDPAGVVHGDNYQIQGITAGDAGVYTITEAGGCSETLSVNVTGSPQNSPPTPPGVPIATNVTTDMVDLSWNPSSDDVAVSGYRVFSGTTLVASSTNNAAQITGLTPNTSYSFTVRAFDGNNAESTASGAVNVITLSNQGSDTNVALGKTAEQSSVYNGRTADIAVDGDTDGNGEAKVTHTNSDDQMWWQVDLGGNHNVNEIHVYNRTDFGPSRLQFAEIYVGNADTKNPSDYTLVGTLGPSAQVQEFNGLSVSGRYVMVHLLKSSGNDKFLSLAEVEVYGAPVSNPGPGGDSVWTANTYGISFNATGTPNGNVGIGTTPQSNYRLAVDGTIHTREVRVDDIGWADYVFEDDYRLPSLQQVQEHIESHGHLINVPSAKEVEANGIELGEMNKILLEKIEELTLYILQENKKQKELEEVLKELEQIAKPHGND